jgi:hypothetical protein
MKSIVNDIITKLLLYYYDKNIRFRLLLQQRHAIKIKLVYI